MDVCSLFAFFTQANLAILNKWRPLLSESGL